MRYIVMSLGIAVLLFAGCDYDSPLTTEHNIPIDLSVLGLWEVLPDEEEEVDTDETADRMVILEYSETEYLIRYFVEDYGMYFRGYPIKVGGISCVQLQFIGDEDGPVDEDEKNIFFVASVHLANGELEIKFLNTELVGYDLKGSKALRKAFLEHIDNKELFIEPGRFRKIEKEDDEDALLWFMTPSTD